MISIECEVLREQWRKIASELGILFVAPYVLSLPDGSSCEVACLLPQFGSSRGMIIDAAYSRTVFEAATQAGFGITSMLPERNDLPVTASSYIDCLEDWGWVGPGEAPEWYTGAA